MKTRLASTVQHGHSLVQQAIYAAMWRDAKQNADGTRTFRGGHGHLAFLTNLHRRTIARNLPVLIRNRSIEVIQAASCREGTTYRVYPYTEILRRRKEAGLVLAAGRGKLITDQSVVHGNNYSRPTPAIGISSEMPADSRCDPLRFPPDDVNELMAWLANLNAELNMQLEPVSRSTCVNILMAVKHLDPVPGPSQIARFLCDTLRNNPTRLKSWGGIVHIIRERVRKHR